MVALCQEGEKEHEEFGDIEMEIFLSSFKCLLVDCE